MISVRKIVNCQIQKIIFGQSHLYTMQEKARAVYEPIISLFTGIRDALNINCINRVLGGTTSVSVNYLDVLIYNGLINFGSLLLFRLVKFVIEVVLMFFSHVFEPIISDSFAQTQQMQTQWLISWLSYLSHIAVLAAFYVRFVIESVIIICYNVYFECRIERRTVVMGDTGVRD